MLRVSKYVKEPVFGIGLLSHSVVPVPAHDVPRCPLNSYKICTFKEIAQKYGLCSSAAPCAEQRLSQWLHLSGAAVIMPLLVGEKSSTRVG